MRPALAVLLLCSAALTGCSGESGPSAGPSSTPPTRSTTTSPLPRLALQPIGSFTQPVWVGAAPGETGLYVVEKGGRVLRLSRSGRQEGVVLDISGEVSKGGEQGLLSIAFHPRWQRTHKLYADYTDVAGDTRVVEYTVSAGKAVEPRELLRVDQPYSNHNGGQLLFDRSGMLLIGLGDGGSAGDPQHHAQALGDLLGKVLRIDPEPSGSSAYSIPADNPHADGSGGARPEVWISGVRNPWRFSVDAPTGDLWIGDVGQNEVEEIDRLRPEQQAGANLGWSRYEGKSVYNKAIQAPDAIDPVHTYTHESGGCSVTGGDVYRGSVTALRGYYLFGDYCTGAIQALTPSGEPVTLLDDVGAVVSFGRDARGEELVVDLDGTISRLAAA